MDIKRSDLTIFVYNSGVVLSGGFIAFTFDQISNYTELVPLALVFGFLWTIYYRLVMEAKLPPFDDESDVVDERELPSQDDDPNDDEPPEQGGPDAPWE